MSSDLYSVRRHYSCCYKFGRIDCVGWRLARGEDGRGWSIRVPQDIRQEIRLVQILVKGQLRGTAKLV